MSKLINAIGYNTDENKSTIIDTTHHHTEAVYRYVNV